MYEMIKMEVLEAALDEIKNVVGNSNISFALHDKYVYSKDAWILSVIKFKRLEDLPLPDAIVWPENTQQVSEILKIATKYRVPIIPYGGGAGVVGGIIASKGGIILDLKKMHNVIRIDKNSLVAVVQPGIIGQNLEERLNRFGLTLGHYPMSLTTSTIGGFVATRASGIMSTKYGNIDDMVMALEVVLPTGEIIRTKATPKASNGPDLNRIFIGSEGTLGVITEITLKLHKIPESREFRVYLFEDLNNAINAIREILQKDIYPAIVRLYDEYDTFLTLNRINISAQGNLLFLLLDGDKRIVETESKIIDEICKSHNAKAMDPKIGWHWWEHRYKQYFDLPEVLEGGFADTIEVATTWDKINELYTKVREALESNDLMVLAHFSHLYRTGAAIYFTFVGEIADGPDPYVNLRNAWDSAMNAILEVGGTISHHHGVGIARNPWLKDELGSSYLLLKKLKETLDPSNIMNPGKLGFNGVEWL